MKDADFLQIRDLQKQLAKERKQKETQDDHMEHFGKESENPYRNIILKSSCSVGSGQDDKGQPQSPSTRTSNLDLSRSTKAEAVGVPRVERVFSLGTHIWDTSSAVTRHYSTVSS